MIRRPRRLRSCAPAAAFAAPRGRGRELFACLTAASGSSSKLVRCVSELAP